MNGLALFFFSCGLAAAQGAAAPPGLPDLPEETVIAVFDDGTKLTLGDFKNIYAILPPNGQQGAVRDRKAFLEQWGLLRKLAEAAQKNKLDQVSPNREALEYNRLTILGQAAINNQVTNIIPEPEAIDRYYETNKEHYKQVKVKAIYITFSKQPVSKSVGGRPLLSEEEARAKVRKLLSEIRSGGDFVKLARENSDDQASREKDGDFATLRPTDNIPEAIKTAVFALKQEEVSEPVEQPNGFYLLRAEEISYRPPADVRGEIIETIKQDHFRQWMQQIHDSVKVQFPSAEFLSGGAAAK